MESFSAPENDIRNEVIAPARRLLGYDQRGELFERKNVVFRRISDNYKDQAAKIFDAYRRFGLQQMGFVETSLLPDGNMEHEKLVISYPYEWPANMLKDAVIFHIDLFLRLAEVGLVLKDALPSNILFRNTSPLFVDFLSVVFDTDLGNEAWLVPHKYHDPRFSIYDLMFMPHMLIPLLAMTQHRYSWSRELLSSRSCNSHGMAPTWKDVVPWVCDSSVMNRRTYIKGLAALARLMICRRLLLERQNGFIRLLNIVLEVIDKADVTPPRSGYSYYYGGRDEDNPLDIPSRFSSKQTAIYDLLRRRAPNTLLDIGANTGWYSFLAASLGTDVISMDCDECCVDIIYKRANSESEKILPLVLSFEQLTKEQFGCKYDVECYRERNNANVPLYRAGTHRLRSDMVLLLGLSHHLVLGEGRSIDSLFSVLADVTKKTLVIEFVDLKDEKIVGAPTFFGRLQDFDKSTYNLGEFMRCASRYFCCVEIKEFGSVSRKLLVCDQ